MAKGDYVSEISTRIEPYTEDGTAAITKGDLCIFRVGKVKKIVAATDQGVYGTAVEDIAKSAKGRIILEGVVEMDEGNDGAVTAGDILIPSATTVGDVKKGATVDFSKNYVKSEVREVRLIVGMALDDIAKDKTGRVLLGFRAGLSD